MKRALQHGVVWLSCGTFLLSAAVMPPDFARGEEPAESASPATRPVTPKELSEHTRRGLEWLANRQLPDGGWGQGEESQHMRQSRNAPAETRDTSNVADTSMAILALMRSGSTPAAGRYSNHIRRGLEFICNEIAESDSTSLYVTDVRNTRVQQKLGTYVDTFLAALVLAEVKDRMPDAAGHERVVKALDKTLDKIEKNQKDDGAWANEGWATALSQGLAGKALNRAAQRGAQVDEAVRKRAEQYARGSFNLADGSVSETGSAGVELYARSSNLQSIKDSDDTNRLREADLIAQLAQPTTRPEVKAEIEGELADIRDNRRQLAAAQDRVVERLADKDFVAGFGSNGGEEFLSYANIGETLVATGGDAWEKWDQSMTENLNRIQDPEGSWSGHHCITGRTFCTASALMVLMVDRTETPLVLNIDRE